MINNVNSVANRPRRILVVDDDVDVVTTFKLILEMNGFEVDAYTNPTLALSSFEPNSYGLLLLDINMPTMNGFEVDAYTNPTLALSSFEPNSYGLLLLDINMPTMNGFELFKKMKGIDSKAEVCFITAFEDYREEFRESFPMLDEAKYFIRKPKAIEDLVNHVATILG